MTTRPAPQPAPKTPAQPAAPQRRVLGRSVEKRSIEAITFGPAGQVSTRAPRQAGLKSEIRNPKSEIAVLVLAGTHGDEPKSVFVARQLIDLLTAQPELVGDRTVTIVPEVNPDGCLARTRRNANKVDINRNFPTADWAHGDPRSRYYGGPSPASEPETRVLAKLIEDLRPARIVTIHSIGGDRFCNNWNGPAEAWAKLLSKHNRYPITDDIGYPTPGSFGTWAGYERQIPTITLELPSTGSRERGWKDNQGALLAFIAGSGIQN